MLATIVREVYTLADTTEVWNAIDELCSPDDTYQWSSAGVYCFWDPDEHRVLYIGLARDLWERFGHHNGLLSAPVGASKKEAIADWFTTHDRLGYSIIVQSSLDQPLTRRSIATYVGTGNWTADDLSAEYADQHSEIIEELRHIEGALIQTHVVQHGGLPPWNKVGGSVAGAGTVGVAGDDMLALLTAVADHLVVARATLRELAADSSWAKLEDDAHASRILAITMTRAFGKSTTSNDVIEALTFMVKQGRETGELEGMESLLDSGWLERPSPYLRGG